MLMNRPALRKGVWWLTLYAALAAVLLLSGCGKREAATDCEIDMGPCTKKIGERLSVSFDITPKPVSTMSDRLFSVALKEGDIPITGATVTFELSMPGMYMSNNKVSLSHKGEGIYEGRGVIVRCPSGRKVWRAVIVAERPGRNPAVTGFTFMVDR
jgi:hypothetical protein